MKGVFIMTLRGYIYKLLTGVRKYIDLQVSKKTAVEIRTWENGD